MVNDGGPAPPLGAVIHANAIAVGVYHACALLDDDRVACWGRHEWGQLGNGSLSGVSRGAVVVAGLTGVTRVVAGSGSVCLASGACVLADTTCAVLRDGTVQCWGLGSHGQLGNEGQGRDYFESRPVPLKLTGIVDLAIGSSSACAVVEDGTVSCWGSNARGELGFTSPDCGPYFQARTDFQPPPAPQACQTTPRVVAGLRDVARVSVGGSHQCVVHRDASVTCWGTNTWGQLGNGSRLVANPTPVPPGAPLADLKADQIACGANHTCAVRQGGSVACWGDNSFGTLGLGHYDNNPGFATPTSVPGLANVKSLSVADNTNVALLGDGTAFGWGAVSLVIDKLPNPPSTAAYSPTKLDRVTDAADLATSHIITCVIHADRTVNCWEPVVGDYQVRLQD